MPLPLLTQVAKSYERYMTTTENPGLCISCGSEQEGCEADAQRYQCEECGEPSVYGAEFVLQHNLYRRDEP